MHTQWRPGLCAASVLTTSRRGFLGSISALNSGVTTSAAPWGKKLNGAPCPFPFLPCMPPPFSSPSPFFPLELRSRSLKCSQEVWWNVLISPAGSGAEPQRKSILEHFSLQNLTFGDNNFNDFWWQSTDQIWCSLNRKNKSGPKFLSVSSSHYSIKILVMGLSLFTPLI